MAINNLNPRRTVWFSPHEPSNKYDIWLSKNAHYDENGEPTTDSNAQRDCDYIFKIYDCGKWNPIVGFNTTAAYKIDIVEGNTLYHPAIFTGENPNDLYDAGTLGSLLSNPNFVTEEEWYNVFNSSNYNWGDIFGDTNWFGDLTWSIIQGGSSDYHIPWADTDVCGGIYSDIHPNSSAVRRAGIQVRFTSTDRNLYDHDYGRIPSHHLAITGDQIINTINDWYNENPGQPGININIENIIQQIIDTFDDEYPLLIGGNGILIGQDLQHTQITWKLQGLETAPDGYFPRSKTVGGNHEIEWVPIQQNSYNAGLGIDINQTNNTINQNIEELEEYQGGLKLLTLSQNPDGSITISGDNTELLTVNPYEIQYLNIPGCQNINITLLKSCTNPVYIYLKTEYDLIIDSELDYSGDGLSNDQIKAGNVLITAQFGIAKIEYINNFDPNA